MSSPRLFVNTCPLYSRLEELTQRPVDASEIRADHRFLHKLIHPDAAACERSAWARSPIAISG